MLTVRMRIRIQPKANAIVAWRRTKRGWNDSVSVPMPPGPGSCLPLKLSVVLSIDGHLGHWGGWNDSESINFGRDGKIYRDPPLQESSLWKNKSSDKLYCLHFPQIQMPVLYE
jgi:hypothetical protein